MRNVNVTMRIISLILAIVLTAGTAARADIFATATFEDNTLGALDGQAGGTGFQGNWIAKSGSGTASDYSTVISPTVQMNYSGTDFSVSGGSKAVMLTGNSNDSSASRQLQSALPVGTGNTEVLYYRFLFRYNQGVLAADDRALVAVTEFMGKDSDAGNPWWAEVRAGMKGTNAEDFMLRTEGDNPTDTYTGPTDLSPSDDTYMFVVKYHKAGDANPFYYDYDLYVNPTSKTTEDAEYEIIEKGGYHMGRYADIDWLSLINRGLDTTGTSSPDQVYIDDVVIADTWEEAVTGVPEPITLSLFGIGAAIVYRKRK